MGADRSILSINLSTTLREGVDLEGRGEAAIPLLRTSCSNASARSTGKFCNRLLAVSHESGKLDVDKLPPWIEQGAACVPAADSSRKTTYSTMPDTTKSDHTGGAFQFSKTVDNDLWDMRLTWISSRLQRATT